MKRVNVNLTEDLYEELRKRSFEEHKSISQLFKELLEVPAPTKNTPIDNTSLHQGTEGSDGWEEVSATDFSGAFSPAPKPGKKK